MKTIDIRELAGSDTLSGALRGQEFLAKLISVAVHEPITPEPLFLDFSGIQVATASFLRESVLAFRNHLRARRSMFYSVVANPKQYVRDELDELAKARGEVLIFCTLSERGEVTNWGIIGNLDPKQRLTFDLVVRKQETDAVELLKETQEAESVGATAWNNRLSALVSLGLIMEITQGRSKRYRPLFIGA